MSDVTQLIEQLYEHAPHGTTKAFIVSVWNCAANYENSAKLERLRDEFAIEMAGKILMKLNFTGSFPNVNHSHEMLMKQAYELADAALKAREVKP